MGKESKTAQEGQNKTSKHPWIKANPLSVLMFTWMWPIFRIGTKRDLEPNDLYPAPDIYETKQLADKFSIEWEKQSKEAIAKGKQPKLYRVLLKLCQRNLILYFLILGFDELVIRVAQPITLRLLIKSFTKNSDVSRRDQIIYGAAVCACTFLHNFVMEHTVFLMLRTGLICRVSLSSILYQKIMRLSPYARKNATTGKMMNLMTNDLGRFDLGFIFVGYTILGPLQACIYIYFLWTEIGVGTLGGSAMILIILPLQVLNGHWTARFRENVAKQTDERSRIMNETILAIKVIKMMAWENPFAQLVHKIRRMEVKALGKKMYLKGFYLSMYTVCLKLTPFLSILWYVLIGNRITADKAFFTIAVFQIIIECMVYYFSIAVASLGEVWISIRRIQEVLLMEEQGDLALKQGDSALKTENFVEGKSSKIIMENANASWTVGDTPAINNFNLNIEGDKLVMIIGAVGSGKSSLLHALISELPLSSGKCNITGSVAYAAQEPWLFAGTVKDNILFGKEYDKELYSDVVRVSALEDDFKQLPNGELTIVGERGMSLSGGQKARINLARALYRDTDIVLLDDPLSAVDSKVSRHIFDKCVRTYLRGRLRVLATHQLQYMSFADHVVVIKNGKILAQGKPTEVQAMSFDLISLLEGHEGNAAEEKRKQSIASNLEPLIADLFEEDEDDEDDESELLIEGRVGWRTYWGYVRSGDSVFGLAFVIFQFILGQLIVTLADYWLAIWTEAEEELDQKEDKQKKDLDSDKPLDILNTKNYYGDRTYIAVYGIIILCVVIIALTRSATCFRYFLQISVNLHNRMFQRLIRAPAQFFDDNHSGRIMNRFTKDIGTIDELLPGDLYDAIEYILQCFGVVVVVVISNYYLSIPSFILFITVLGIRFVFLKASRDLKRIESHVRSPVLSHLAASIQGMTTIRALKAQDESINKFNKLQDIHTAPWFLFLQTDKCFTVWIGTISASFLTAIVVAFLIMNDDKASGLIGFVVTSTILLTTTLQWSLREAAQVDNYMTCVARSLEYTVLESEAEWESKPDKRPPTEWPTEGKVKFDNVSLAYGDTDVLKNLTFEIPPRGKIGIVGRTGAGKSTVISALFRITEPRGDIFIDGVKINDIGLHELRKQISIIPQDPVLFSGTIRYNLDPFNQYNDSDVWKVIEEVHLKENVDALDAPVEDGGSNFSTGQRQLICLARAILRKNKIIVMDEATANVDPKTDAFIQGTIREKFRECSIITIAHRLQTVMDCDKILVLENGCMQEYDHPHLLLQNENGFLSKLVSFAGENAKSLCKEIARKHYERTLGANQSKVPVARRRSVSILTRISQPHFLQKKK